MSLVSLPGVCRWCGGGIHLHKTHTCENPFKKFQIRTESRQFPHLEEKPTEEWTEHYPDAVFQGRYVFFTIVTENASKAIESIREKTGAKWIEISIWAFDEKPPWKPPSAKDA